MPRLSKRLSPPYEFGWSLRKVEEADVVQTTLGDGRREILITHRPLTGITLDMLDWWFQNFDGMAQYRGKSLPAYHLWHPRDHIKVEFFRGNSARVAPGQEIIIQEVFGRNPRFELEGHAVIHRWDRRGVGFHLDVLGHRIMELDHVFADTDSGVDYRSRMRIGAGNGPLRRFINTVLVPRRFSSNMAAAWIKHNVEEVGCFVEFLPELFAVRGIVSALMAIGSLK